MTIPVRFDAEAEQELTAAAAWYEARRVGLADGAVRACLEKVAVDANVSLAFLGE